MQVQFPPNPTDGEIFEAIPGLFYQYNKSLNEWVRIDGVDSLGIATPLMDGLMSKEDLQKLQDLIIPPPQATLTGEDCVNTVFRGGKVSLRSLNNSLEIAPDLQVGMEGPQPWRLHQNTAGVDFRLDINKLIQDLTANEQFSKVQIEGDQGPRGFAGQAGVDNLDTGPKGNQGAAGANSVFTGALRNERIPLELIDTSSTKAIVDITTEEISNSENYLVVTRANVGNPDACPAEVIPNDFSSSLGVVINQLEDGVGRRVNNRTISNGDCSLICRICATSLHDLDLLSIVNQIFDHFKVRVNRLKKAKEDLVKVWLRVMLELFNEQKATLCCALENCKSRERNQRTRQYIESQRVQAAQGDFSLVINDKKLGQTTNMNEGKACPVPEPTITTNPVTLTADGAIFRVDARINVADPRLGDPTKAVTTNLPAATYQIKITDCCANLKLPTSRDLRPVNNYTGRVAILYRAKTMVGLVPSGSVLGESEVYQEQLFLIEDLGVFQTESEAKSVYQSLTFAIDHAGGPISIWTIDPDGFSENNSGFVEVTLTNTDALTSVDLPVSPSNIYVYREELNPDRFIARITPYVTGLAAADNYGLDSEGNASPVVGPVLTHKDFGIFFVIASDGFFINILGKGEVLSEQFITNAIFRTQIDNSSLQAQAVVSDEIVTRLSSNLFEGRFGIDTFNNFLTGGTVIGPIDNNADYSVIFDPINLGGFTRLIAGNAGDDDVTLATGNENGIGAQTSIIADSGAVQLFDVCNVPEGYDPDCGMEVVNNIPGQNVVISRPVDIEVPEIREQPAPPTVVVPQPLPGLPPETQAPSLDPEIDPGCNSDWVYSRPSKAYFGPGSTGALPWGKLYADRRGRPPLPRATRRVVNYDPKTGEIDDPMNPGANYFEPCPPPESEPVVPIEPIPVGPPPGNPEQPEIGDPDQELPPGADGDTVDAATNIQEGNLPKPQTIKDRIFLQKPDLLNTNPDLVQDPCIQDIIVTMVSDSVQSVRYVLTDVRGNKFYSAFVSNADIPLNAWGFISFGPPIRTLRAPSVFTISTGQDEQTFDAIRDKNIPISALTDVLTREQLKVAESLKGIARLTYVQGLLGQPIDALPAVGNITDIEFEFQSMPATTAEFGVVRAVVGVRDETVEVIIDDFEKPPKPPTPQLFRAQGSIKRVVATQSRANQSSVFYTGGFAGYYGDHFGHPKVDPFADARGNNFFLVNRGPNDSAGGNIVQITKERGFKNLRNRFGQNTIDLKNPDGLTVSVTGAIRGDALAVDDLGVLYIADGPAGVVYAVNYFNALGPNRTFGDASDTVPNFASVVADGLKTTNEPLLILGDRFMKGPNLIQQLVCNFGGQWYKLDSTVSGAVWQARGPRGLFKQRGRIRVGTRLPDEIAGRCCGFRNPDGTDAPAGNVRMVAFRGSPPRTQTLGSSRIDNTTMVPGNSITSDRPFNVQPTFPVSTPRINQTNVEQFDEELERRGFKNHNFYVMRNNKILQVFPENGSEIEIGTTPISGFSLRMHPKTKKFYYIAANKSSSASVVGSYNAGNIIMKFDPTAEEDELKHTELLDIGDSGVFTALTFLPPVPNNLSPLTTLNDDQALYAVKANLPPATLGTWEIVEIAEQLVPFDTGPEPPDPLVTNSTWMGTGTGGIFEGAFGNPNRIIFSRIPPGTGCLMNYQQVQWYERGWRIGACCGAWVEYAGQQWLVVKRSIGADISCGGGESANTPCIAQFIDRGEGHPAIAWPTIDGEEFLGIPRAGFVSFMKDQELSDQLLSLIQGGVAAEVIGSPSTEIPFILFPSM